MICKNCGAKISPDDEKCPYCGTMITKGAFKAYRKRLFSYKDKVDNLVDDGYKSLSEMVIKSIVRALLIVFVCVIVGIIWGMIFSDRTRIDTEYENDIYNDILWQEANFPIMDKAYNSGNYDEVAKIMSENYSICSKRYAHYDIVMLNDNATNIFKDVDDFLEDSEIFKLRPYEIAQALSFLYNPSDLVKIDFDEKELELYEKLKADIYKKYEKIGINKTYLDDLYQRCNIDGRVDFDLVEKEFGGKDL